MTSGLQVRPIHSAQELASDLEAWRDLVANAPMRLPEWLLGWWEHYRSTHKDLCVLRVGDASGALMGLMPLYIDNVGGKRVVRWLGEGAVCTDHTSCFCRSGHECAVAECVARYLLGQPDFWSRLHLEAVDVDDLVMNHLVTCLEQGGCLSSRTPALSCWSIPLPTAWDEFLMTLSKSHRKRCRRLMRSFFDSGRVAVHRVTTADQFDRGWRILMQLHAARWGDKSRPEGVFGDQRFHQFHEATARQLLQRQQLQLQWLECDGQPVAAEYQLVDDTTIYAYQSGMDPAWSEVQPGNLSILATLQDAIARGIQSCDLLRGDEPYKAHWRAEEKPCCHVRVWPGSFASRIEHAMWGARELASQWLRPG